MAQVINTNSLSLLTQNNLNKSQSSLSSAIERLSSGLRINSAKDDAAGQAIANRFTSNIKGLSQASRNANDGISVAQTTEGALSEINNNLQRVRELAVQATSGTNSKSDLDSIQNEIGQRLSEIDRVSGQTQFNGVKVLASDSSMKIQVGANDGETISIDLKEITSKTLGLQGFNVNGKGEVANKAATTDTLTLDGFAKASTANADGGFTYSKDVSYKAATASDVLANAKNNNTIAYTGTDTGLNQPATAGSYKYDAASKSYSFDATGVSKDTVLNKLAPKAGDSFSAKVTINSKSQDVTISNDGTVKTADGKALYLDEKGNLTQTGSGTVKNATWDALIANSDTTRLDDGGNAGSYAVATKIEAGGMTINSVGGDAQSFKTAQYNTTYAGLPANAAAAAIAAAAITTPSTTVVSVQGATISADQMAKVLDGKGFTLTDGTGGSAPVYTVAAGTGAVTFDSDGTGGPLTSDPAYVKNDGVITNTASEKLEYYAHANGAVTNKTGSTLYQTAEGKLTTEATTKSESTKDPLKALDDALAKVDSLRSDLGAVQNRFDSTITNLGNTINNLSSARSRIEDADYATEVSNMSRAQILQQAGTSVLAQANQTTQGVLSLLR